MKLKQKYILLGAIILLVFCLILLWTRYNIDGPKDGSLGALKVDEGAVVWEGNQNLSDRYESGGIAIPGFDRLTFAAGATKQRVNFHNPETNNCLFLMALYVDNRLYWKSGYVEPGKGYYSITLFEALPAGIYEAALQVQCYKQSGEELNSAKIEFELTVTEVN